jgi:hypothetical protein
VHFRLLTITSLGLLAAACQAPDAGRYNQSAGPPVPSPAYTAAYSTSGQACADYGFVSGTAAFDRCVSREQAARSSGRVNRDYAQARLSSDARDACSSYGLAPGSGSFNQCVGREVDARSYRDGTVRPGTVAYRTDQYGHRVDSEGYRVDTNGNRVSGGPAYVMPSRPETGPYIEARQAVVGQQATRDEYGFRYDAYGNRIDRNGRIISPQSTTP